MCYLARNPYHLQLVILHSADVLSTTLLQSSLQHELYIRCDSIAVKLFPVLRQSHVCVYGI